MIKHVRVRVKANRTLNNLQNTKSPIFSIFTEKNIAKTTNSRQKNSRSCMLLSIAEPKNTVFMRMYVTTAVILNQHIIPAATAIVPNVKGIAKRKWVEARIDELLPVAHHHATFTIPNQISVLSLHNQKLIYDLLFNAASQTLLIFGDDPRWLGAKIGFYGILHTWSQTLWPHVHLHFIVTAGGLNADGKWIEPKYKGRFLFPVQALSIVFRGKFIEGLKDAYYAGELVLPVNLKIKDDDEFEQWIDLLVSKNWVVNSKPPFSGPEKVVRYIGRYTHRIAISNHRIISIADGQVCFSYKDNKEKDKSKVWKEMILPVDQFIKRFLWHVLPKRYHRIRHYGFLTNGKKKANLEIIREFFKSEKDVKESVKVITTDDTDGIICPKCKKGKLRSFFVTDRYGQILKFDLSVFPKKEASDTS